MPSESFKNLFPVFLKDWAKKIIIFINSFTGFMRLKPEIFIPGIKKGGTTSLYNYLVLHPQIKNNIQKETHYFDHFYEKGINWYSGNFPLKSFFNSKKYYVVDATPTYIFDLNTIKRIKKFNPKAKLIFVLRNPKVRAYSEYQYCLKLLYKNKEHSSFEERIEGELTWLKENEKNFKDFDFINTVPQKARLMGMGLYYIYLQEWFKNFDRNQIYITTSEKLFEDTENVLAEIIDFLNLEKFDYKNLKKYNENKYSRKYDTPLFKEIADYYKPYNQALEKLIKKPLNWD